MTPLPLVTGPYFNHTARKRHRKRLHVALIFVVVALLTLFLAHSLRAIVRHTDAQFRIDRTSWLSEEESSRLKRHHGVLSLRVGENTAEIYRDGEWIIVKRRGEE